MRFPSGTEWFEREDEREGDAYSWLARPTIHDAANGVRCAREALRLMALSDNELAKIGVARDDVVAHAFRYHRLH